MTVTQCRTIRQEKQKSLPVGSETKFSGAPSGCYSFQKLPSAFIFFKGGILYFKEKWFFLIYFNTPFVEERAVIFSLVRIKKKTFFPCFFSNMIFISKPCINY